MIQCEDCEYYRQEEDGSPRLLCSPFGNIKEPECIAKWQLMQLTIISRSHQATLAMQQRLAPLQEKMFRHLEREIDEAEEGESWKMGEFDDEEDDEEDDPFRV